MSFIIPFVMGAVGLGSSALVTGGVATAATAAAAGAGATVGGLALAGGAVYAGSKALTGFSNKGDLAAPVTAPNAPQNYAAILANESQSALKRAQSRTKTILTSPLGVTDNANSNVQRKTLLGQ